MNESAGNVATRFGASTWTADALDTLGVDQLALIAFDACLPQASTWDVGTGSPYSAAAWEFFSFARNLGFNAIQFGPQGAVSRSNASPYDGTAFSRNTLAIALDDLAATASEGGWGVLAGDEVEQRLQARPSTAEHRVAHTFAFDTMSELLARAAARCPLGSAERTQRYADFVARNAWWLKADGLYDALCRHHVAPDFSAWPSSPDGVDDGSLWNQLGPLHPAAPDLFGHALPGPQRARLHSLYDRFAADIDAYGWLQFIVHEQHYALQARAQQLGLSLYGDLQVGYSRQDCWHFNALFLDSYVMGAPPSRTNAEGQAWGYPVLDPTLYERGDGSLGPALELLHARALKHFSEYSRLRIDHPHGLVCPWVYRSGTGDDLGAVKQGARLFSSPDLPDHPELQRYSLVNPGDIDPTVPRYHERRVCRLSSVQVKDFARCVEVLASQARARGGLDHIICEVLSTLPFELGAVLQRYGLGRFRVTQKSNLKDEHDVYRSENARPEDWVLLGNHDTPAVWQVVKHWAQSGQLRERADYLASRLGCNPEQQQQLASRFREDSSELVHAALADLFACRARNVLIGFTDLFGLEETYNAPGVVSADNWSLRLPRDFAQRYASDLRSGRALSLDRALRLALGRIAPESWLLKRESPHSGP